MSIYDAAMQYAEDGMPLVVLAGKEYGSGSSRDWAAKGTNLLGVRAVIAESFERIHRSNLVGMGVLPLQFADGESAESLGLTGEEEFSITGIERRRGATEVTVKAGDKEFTARVRIDTPKEVEYYQHGGILPVRAAPAARGRPLTLLGRCRPRGPAQAADRRRALGLRAGARRRRSATPRARVRRGRRDDTVGSTVARVPGTGDGPLVAVIGHIDEIGLIVHHIDDDGFLWFTGVGGWDPMILVGQRVELATRDGAIPGVVGKKPIHLLKDEERKKAPELKDLHIDIGAKDGDEARALRAHRRRRGDRRRAGRAAQRPRRLALDGQPPRLLRRARGGAAASPRRAARRATSPPSPSRRRRSPSRGARTTAYALEPDVAIVVDVTHATDAPGIDEKELGRHHFGSGPVIERGSTLDPRVFELLHETAEAEGIPFTVEASRARHAAPTPTRSTSRARGIPTGRRRRSRCATCTRRSRSSSSTTSRHAARLIAAFARRLSPTSTSCAEAARCCCSTSTARCCSGRRASTRGAARGRLREVHGVDRRSRRTGRGRGAHRRRDRARPAARLRRRGERDRPRGRGGRARAVRGLRGAVPGRPVARSSRPAIPELLEALAARPAIPALAGDRQLRAGRAAEARARRDRRLLPGGPGRLRVRRRGARGAAADRPRAGAPATWPRERTVVIGDTPRDIACARADGLRVIAVATGPFAAAQLAEADAVAAGAAGCCRCSRTGSSEQVGPKRRSAPLV